MNKAVIIGNLTKDPELKVTPSGISVCTFTVAVARGFGEKKETDFLPVVAWRALAENCGKYLSKGKKAAVSGRVQTRSYEDAKGGKRYVTEIVADDVEFLSPKGETRDEKGNAPEAEFEPLGDEEMPF